MKVIIFCVNYNSDKELEKYLISLERAIENADVELTVVVSDNSLSYKEIERKYSFELYHFKTEKNLGYFGGAIFGIKRCGKNIDIYDYSVISNVDLEVDKNFFKELSAFCADDKTGCIAPKIYSVGEHRDRNPKVLERYGVRKLQLLRLMYKYPFLNYIYTAVFFKRRRERIKNCQQDIIYAAHGSFMLFTKKFSSFLSNMEYPVFLFGEELYIAEHLRKRGLKTIYLPNVVVIDKDHASTSKMKSKFYYKCNYEAIDMIIKEFYNE